MDLQDLLEFRDLKGKAVHQATLAKLDHQVTEVNQVLQDLLDHQVLWASLGQRGLLVFLVILVRLAILDHRGLQEILVLQVLN